MKKNFFITGCLIILLAMDYLPAQPDSTAGSYNRKYKDSYSFTLQRSFKAAPHRPEPANLEIIPLPEVEREFYTHYSKNYFKVEDIENSLWNGKHWSEDKFPLKLYVKSCSSELYKTMYRQYVDYAVKIWEKADKRISFIYVTDEDEANIILKFEENLMNKYDENYLGLTDYEINQDRKIEKVSIEISLQKYNKKMITNGEVKSTIIHELGHALGLGHSNNEMDIMYPYINPRSPEELSFIELSFGDVQAIKSVINLRDKKR